MAQPVIISYNPDFVVNIPVGSVAINVGDLVTIESNALAVVDAAADCVYLAGVSMGKAAANAGGYLPVALKCIVLIDADSEARTLGDALGYSAANKVKNVANGTKMFGWYLDEGKTSTTVRMLVDVPLLGIGNTYSTGVKSHLFETPMP